MYKDYTSTFAFSLFDLLISKCRYYDNGINSNFKYDTANKYLRSYYNIKYLLNILTYISSNVYLLSH